MKTKSAIPIDKKMSVQFIYLLEYLQRLGSYYIISNRQTHSSRKSRKGLTRYVNDNNYNNELFLSIITWPHLTLYKQFNKTCLVLRGIIIKKRRRRKQKTLIKRQGKQLTNSCSLRYNCLHSLIFNFYLGKLNWFL